MASQKSPATTASAPSNTVDITTLPAQHLSSLKSQLDTELTHLTNSFQKLRAAQEKFRDCIKSIKDGLDTKNKNGEKKTILVPLTSSLYVPGTLVDSEKVIVDIGTGFFVEKSAKDAIKFYEGKIEELGANLKGIEEVVRGKSANLRVIEDVLRQKVLQQQGQGQGSGAAGAPLAVGAS